MAYTSGTASGYKDLLALMVTFAVANGWVVDEQTADKVFMHGTGLSGLDEIYVGVATYENVPTDCYNWVLNGAWAYRAGRTYDVMPLSSGLDNAIGYFWNQPIPYWMVATPRRIIVVVKVGSTFQHVHLGLLTVPGTENQYPYPLLIGGSGDIKTENYTNANRSAYWNCIAYTKIGGMFCVPGGDWVPIRTGYTGAPSIVEVASFTNYFHLNLAASIDGHYMLEQLYVKKMKTYSAVADICGAIEGLFYVSGYNQSSENIITVGGINYMTFQDCSRSAIGDFCALRMN
jgi:hypothetical protein